MGKTPVKIINKTPKKKGKQEYREFKTLEEAAAWIAKNLDRLLGNKKG